MIYMMKCVIYILINDVHSFFMSRGDLLGKRLDFGHKFQIKI